MARSELGSILSAVEFMDKRCVELVFKHLPGAVNPLSSLHPLYLLIETHGNDEQYDQQLLNNFFEKIFEKEIASDGTMATDHLKAKQLWALRETISESLRNEGPLYKYDISSLYYQLMD